MKLQELNSKIHSHLKSSNIIKSNISSTLQITETKNLNIPGTLKNLYIENIPLDNCWIFEHEDCEIEFLTAGSKVEKTILYLDTESERLYIIPIELKTELKIKQLEDCVKKLTCSLSYLSIFLATNNHLVDSYNDYKINFRLAIFCTSETISNQHPSYNSQLCKDFILFQNGTNERFNIDVNSPSLGFLKVPSIRILQSNTENITIQFQDLLNLLK